MVDKDRIEGAGDKVKGSMKEGVGKLTGDQKLQGEAVADKTKGAAKSMIGGIRIRSAMHSRNEAGVCHLAGSAGGGFV